MTVTVTHAEAEQHAGPAADPFGPVGVVRILGRPTFEVGGQERKLPSKAFVLIAVLTVSPQWTATRTRLRSILWGNRRQSHAAANLRQLLARIARVERRTGCRLIECVGDSVRLVFGDVRVDATVLLARPPATAGPGTDLATAVKTYGGDLLAEFNPTEEALDEWLARERDHMKSVFLTAAATLLQSGTFHPNEELEIAARLLAVDPTHEVGHRARIRAFGVRGDISRARAAFRECRRVLRDEHDVAPSPETVALASRFFDTTLRQYTPLEPRSPGPGESGRPRVTILPPVDPFDEPRLRALCAFLLEDLTTGLARYRSFRVIAKHTAMAMAAGTARGMNVVDWTDYVVAPSLLATRDGYELKYRLTDARSNEVAWAASLPFDGRDLPDLFATLADQAVMALASAVERREVERPVASDDKSAYRFFLEGRRYAASTSLPEVRRARRLFREAAKRDPHFAAARAGIARTQSMEWLVRGAPEPEFLLEAVAEADCAIAADDHDARGYREKGYALLYLKRHDEALALFSEAAKRNPNDADLLADYADALAHSGDPGSALTVLDRAAALNPVQPPMYRWIRGSIFYQTGRYHDGIAVMNQDRRDPATARLLAACHARVGEAETARAYVRLSRQALPDFATEDLWRIVSNRNPADTRHYVDGLLSAGFL